jgi:hypothetical protein
VSRYLTLAYLSSPLTGGVGLPEFNAEGILLPDPTPEYRPAMTRDDAIRLMQVLDDSGFDYSLNVSGSFDRREYSVYVRWDEMAGDRLRELQDAVDQVAEAVVVKHGVLIAS